MIYTEKRVVNPQKDVNLETIRYFSDSKAPNLVFVKGIGGSAGNREGLIDKLAQDYSVLTFSPRNSGNSNGAYTVENLLSDTSFLFEEEIQRTG